MSEMFVTVYHEKTRPTIQFQYFPWTFDNKIRIFDNKMHLKFLR